MYSSIWVLAEEVWQVWRTHAHSYYIFANICGDIPHFLRCAAFDVMKHLQTKIKHVDELQQQQKLIRNKLDLQKSLESGVNRAQSTRKKDIRTHIALFGKTTAYVH